VVAQTENQPSQKEINEKLKGVYRKVLKASMKANLEKKD
jgi:hypothetical protein